ncbi:MAG: hypothetical protein JXO51_05015 [Candidatus Aminicenantes bacterium]|nr:hypothetical protein [Candidatus Aminicenantes bacterium]
MKKIILCALVALLSILLLAQDETPVPAPVEPQVQEPEQAPAQPVAAIQEKNLRKIRFPQAFVHAGKEYPAGEYWLVLTDKDGRPVFMVRNAQQELLFEELAVVKDRPGRRRGSSFWVRNEFMRDKEYFRVKVTTPGQWLMGYFLVKK